MTRRFGLPDPSTLADALGIDDGRVGRLLQRSTDRAAFVCLVAAVVAFGYVRGSALLVVNPPLVAAGAAVVALQAVVSAVTFSTFFSLSGVVMARDLLDGRDAPATARDGPRVEAVVPVANDAAALHRSVESLAGSDYDDLRVTVVCEPDDDPCLARAAELAAEHDGVKRLVNTRYPGSKAGAINYAVEVTDAPLVGVFDADECVDPAFVPRAVARIRRGADAVQGRTVPEPEGLVETVAYYESVLLSQLSHRLVGLVTGFRMATSRSLVVRRSAFEAVGGYDPSMLTEDFDFAFRCFDAGVAVEEEFAAPSAIEAAHDPRDWWGQRKRWMTGYAQVLHRRLSSLRPFDGASGPGRSSNWRSLLAVALCAGAVLGNLLLLSLVSKTLVLVVSGHPSVLAVPLATVVAVSLAIRALDARSGAVDGLGVGWLFAPLVFPLYGLVGVKGLVEYAVSWDGEWYHAAKDG